MSGETIKQETLFFTNILEFFLQLRVLKLFAQNSFQVLNESKIFLSGEIFGNSQKGVEFALKIYQLCP